jgi:hypothetical protein
MVLKVSPGKRNKCTKKAGAWAASSFKPGVLATAAAVSVIGSLIVSSLENSV